MSIAISFWEKKKKISRPFLSEPQRPNGNNNKTWWKEEGKVCI
jgi:hypothetical protein